MSFFGKLFETVFHQQHDEQTPRPPTVEELEAQLDQVLKSVQAQSSELRNEIEEAEERRETVDFSERDWQRDKMAEEILAMHQRLDTGLDADALGRVALFLKEHAPPTEAPQELALQVDYGVLNHLWLKVGELAWKQLSEAMGADKLEWELSPEMLHGREPESVVHLKTQREKEIHQAFIALSASQTADLIHGEVRAWTTFYPKKGGWVWNETVLQGVGAGLRARYYEAALSLWEDRPAELDEVLRGMMKQHLAAASKALASGIHSLDEANSLVSGLRQCCRETLPKTVWKYLEPLLLKEFAGLKA